MEKENRIAKVYCECEEGNDWMIQKIREFIKLIDPAKETPDIEKADIVIVTDSKDLPPEDGKQYLVVNPDIEVINTNRERNNINFLSSKGGYEKNLLWFFDQLLEINQKKYISSL